MTVPISKAPSEIKALEFNLALFLASSESVVSAAVGTTSPPGITVNIDLVQPTFITATFSGGTEGVTYGTRFDITTSGNRTFPFTVACLVSSQIGSAYTMKNPEAVQTLVDTIYAGDSAIGRGLFTFPSGFNAIGGYVTWELLDSDGITYSNGNAYDLIVTPTSIGVKVEAEAIITVPSDTPINLDGLRYQIRWTLKLPDNQVFYTYENISVLGRASVPQGVEDLVEMAGDPCNLGIVVPQYFDHIGVELYAGSHSTLLLSYTEATERVKTPDGYYCTTVVDSSSVEALLEPVIVMWKYWNEDKLGSIFRDTGRLFVLNASIMSAVSSLRAYINRSRATIAHEQDMVFTVPYLLEFLRQGRDAFNGAYGMLTNFTMTDATSSMRQYWIEFAAIRALRSQFIAEGEKAFNFSGQAITLDVDRTSMYDSAASALQSRMDNECKNYKAMLIRRGIISGSGNLDNIGLRKGAIGSVGISLTQASNWSRFQGKLNSGMR